MKIEGTRMTNIKYLSITEFAEKAGVSKQAIYKQISNAKSQLAPYVYRDGKPPLIEITALSKLYGVEIENSTFSTDNQPFSTAQDENSTLESTRNQEKIQPVNPNSTRNNQPFSTDYIEFLKAQIEELKADRAEIEQRLTATIQEKDNIIKDQTAQLAQLAQQVAQIADKALLATSQQQYLTAMEKTNKAEISDEITEDAEEAPKEEQQAKKKKSFWSWLTE